VTAPDGEKRVVETRRADRSPVVKKVYWFVIMEIGRGLATELFVVDAWWGRSVPCIKGNYYNNGIVLTVCSAGVLPPDSKEALTASAAVSNDVRASITAGCGVQGTVIT